MSLLGLRNCTQSAVRREDRPALTGVVPPGVLLDAGAVGGAAGGHVEWLVAALVDDPGGAVGERFDPPPLVGSTVAGPRPDVGTVRGRPVAHFEALAGGPVDEHDVVRRVDEADLVDLVGAAAVETRDLPARGRGAGEAVRGGGAAGEGAPQVGGELRVEHPRVVVVLGLAEVRAAHVLVAAQGERRVRTARPAVGQPRAVVVCHANLVDTLAAAQ